MTELHIHKLKTWPTYFDAVAAGQIRYQVRRNDRFFQSGDIVELIRLKKDHGFDGFIDYDAEPLRFQIGAILQGGQFGIQPGYCVFSLLDL